MKKTKKYTKEAVLKPEASYDISIKELPPVPEFFEKGLENIGGIHSETGKPILRVRSALDYNPDDDMAIFAAEKWHRKYVGAIDHIQEVIGFRVINKKNQKSNFLSVKDAQATILDSNNTVKASVKKLYAVIPMMKFEDKEYGIPRYVIERYASAEEFGGEKDWEENRWLPIDDPLNPHKGERQLDLLGPYPRGGRYVFLVFVESGVEEGGKIVRTEGRLLDESVLEETAELIKDMRVQAEKTVEQRISEAETEANERQAEKQREFGEQLREDLSKVFCDVSGVNTQERVAQIIMDAKARIASRKEGK